MFQNVRKIWNKYGFEIAVGLTLLVILLLTLFRRGKKGSYMNPLIYKQFFNGDKADTPENRGRKTDSKGETECRRVLEELFKKPFLKYRPDFLRNPVTSDSMASNNLELDCYNPELKIAVEYNGIQHYKYVPFFHRTKDAFQNQKYRDHIKREACQKNGIILIEVPYTVKIDEIKPYLMEKLKGYY